MKLLLTSAGLENQSIINALKDLLQKPFSKSKVAFIPTAANLESGDKQDWFIEDLINLKELKFNSIDIVDISALPKEIWLKRLKEADILYVEGGNTYHLMHWFNKSGLSEVLPKLLKNKVYVGISAGTMVITPNIINSIEERPFIEKINETVYNEGLNLVDFMVEPHINSPWFPESTFESLEIKSKNFSSPIYCLDDNSAIKIDGDKIEIISEGNWKKFN
jgi:dipeptidase E